MKPPLSLALVPEISKFDTCRVTPGEFRYTAPPKTKLCVRARLVVWLITIDADCEFKVSSKLINPPLEDAND